MPDLLRLVVLVEAAQVALEVAHGGDEVIAEDVGMLGVEPPVQGDGLAVGSEGIVMSAQFGEANAIRQKRSC